MRNSECGIESTCRRPETRGYACALLDSEIRNPKSEIRNPNSTMLTLTLKEPTAIPLEAECLSPDTLAPLKHTDVRSLPVLLGKRTLRLDEVFDVEGDGSDEIELRGDLGKVKWVGRGMSRG